METTLKAGDRSELVKRLQAALISFGYDLGPSGADGGFGDRTKAAVKSFQGAHGLPATGLANPDTIAAMDLDPDTLKDLIEMDVERPNATTGPGLVEVKKSGKAWHLTFQGYSEAGAVGSYLWPGGVPAGVHITPLVVVEEPTQIGQFEITGLTLDALQSMEPSIANRISEASVITGEEYKPSAGGGAGPGEGANVHVHMDEDTKRKIEEW